jgi:hypothetical protein
MRFDQRRVTQMPLTELWNDNGIVSNNKIRGLNERDIRELLHTGKVHFVVANIGDPLKWIPTAQCYYFWKSEIKHHLNSDEVKPLDDFPDQYCYFASEWGSHLEDPIVLLETCH